MPTPWDVIKERLSQTILNGEIMHTILAQLNMANDTPEQSMEVFPMQMRYLRFYHNNKSSNRKTLFHKTGN